jgi:hypothetical protein
MGVVSTWDGENLPEHNHEFGDSSPEFIERVSDAADFDTVLDELEDEVESTNDEEE